MTRLLSALALAIVLSGCPENAILEIELDLPPANTMEQQFALTQMRRGDMNPFNEDWAGEDLPAIQLGAERQVDRISLVSDDDEVDVHIKVRFCSTDICSELADADAPERWYQLEHPFYLGHRTEWAERIEMVPAAKDTTPTVVERCLIRGCVEGFLRSYCRVDGRHLCE